MRQLDKSKPCLADRCENTRYVLVERRPGILDITCTACGNVFVSIEEPVKSGMRNWGNEQ
jgi:hypothetical protein